MVSELKKIMATKGCGIERLADGINVQYSYVSKVLNGNKKPSKDFIKKAIFFLLSN